MRLEIHDDELMDRFAFGRVPDGDYGINTTVRPDNGEPYDIKWPATIKGGTLYFHSFTLGMDGQIATIQRFDA